MFTLSLYHTINKIYMIWVTRYYMALVTDNQDAFTQAANQLVRIERMYGSPDQDNFYHFRQMVISGFTRKDGKWVVKV